MKKLSFPLLSLITLIVFSASPGQAQWTNGQDALMVTGSTRFYQQRSGPFSHDALIHLKTWLSIRPTVNCMCWTQQITGYCVLPTPSHRISRPPNWYSGNLILISNGTGTTQNTFNAPRGIVVDGTGRLWVSEQGNNRVVWFNAAYSLTANQPAADGVLGQPDFISNGCLAAQNRMCYPYGLAISSNDTLFVADGNFPPP